MSLATLPGLAAVTVDTPRLRVNTLQREGDSDGQPLVLIHGNCSSATYFERLMLALPHDVRPIAIDLRGYGDTETKPVDATRGLADFADDIWAACDALGLEEIDLFGWSMGAGVVMQMMIDAPARVRTATLQAPISPFGFGGTTGVDGELCMPDGAGSGAGGVNPRFVELLAAKDGDGTLDDNGAPEQGSPRATIRGFYLAPATPYPDEDRWVDSLLTTATGLDNYPGDAVPSANWPGSAPGNRGVLNAMAPTHFNVSRLAGIEPKPPILWVRGDADLIVSDSSLLDLATLGSLGYVPGWPGADVMAPQPMIAQTRAVFEAYAGAGGRYRELVLPGIGHSPHLEAPAEVLAALVAHLGAN